jgi:hypothetical protein
MRLYVVDFPARVVLASYPDPSVLSHTFHAIAYCNALGESLRLEIGSSHLIIESLCEQARASVELSASDIYISRSIPAAKCSRECVLLAHRCARIGP